MSNASGSDQVTATAPLSPVAVLGFGAMGSGIALVCAQAGVDVVVLEPDAAQIQRGEARLQASSAKAVARGKLTELDAEQALARIRCTDSVSDLNGAQLVIEAVTEDLDVKVEVLRAVVEVVGPAALIATNTSALSVTGIAGQLPNPERVAGLHFFNPVPAMQLVEVVRALQTDDAVVAALLSFTHHLGKVGVEVKDSPGFIVNRLLMPYLNDVVQAYDDGIASAEDIDVALELGLGYPVGPLAMLDRIGLDVHLHATTNAYEATLDPQYAPPPLLRRMVAAGRLGTKTGSGFRTHPEEN